MKIIEKHDRKVLHEGRNCGIGFAILSKISNDEYHTVHPISPCKDYLNEVVVTEHYGYGTSSCGLTYPRKNNVFTKIYSYLVMLNQKTKSGLFAVDGFSFEQYSQMLIEKYKNIENFLNNFQEEIGIKRKVTITLAEDNHFLVKFDTIWTQSSHSISLFTLLLRVGKDYEGGSVIDYLTKLKCISFIDTSLIRGAFPKIETILKEKRLPKNKKDLIMKKETPHNYGILAWDGNYDNEI